MTTKTKSLLLWIFAVIFTLATAYYQRKTGPTYPVTGKVMLSAEEVSYKLIRTYGGEGDARLKIKAPASITGVYTYKRFKSHDEWKELPMVREGDELVATFPHQPPAGKIEYSITLSNGVNSEVLTTDPVIIRFKGDVPAFVLIPHILLMFLAMLLSTRTGIEAIIKGGRTYTYTIYTLLFLIPGGMILGPIVQKYAFDAYWTGWPIGHDLTDNKTALAFIMWIVAFVMQWRNRRNFGWAIAAAIILTAVYLIPHSMFGSEIDHTQAPMP